MPILEHNYRIKFGGNDRECKLALALAKSYHEQHQGDKADPEYLDCLEGYLASQDLPDGAIYWAVGEIT